MSLFPSPDRKAKAPAPRRTAAETNPYLDGRREWMERYGSYVQQARSWRAVAFVAIGIAALSVGGMVWIGAQNKIVPYVVEVNKLGEAMAVRPADVAPAPDRRIIAASIARWVVDSRSVYADAAALRHNIDELYAMLAAKSPAEFTMSRYFQGKSPFERAQSELVSVVVDQPLLVTGDTWRVEWRETIRPRSGSDVTVQNWAATVTIGITTPTTPAAIIANPGGVFVKDFNWAQRL